MNEWVKKWLPEIKKYWYVPMMVLLGFVMMTQQFKQPEAVEVSEQDTADMFISKTELRVTEMLRSVEGAGECIVTITLSSGGKKEYVREDGNVLVITDEDGNQSAVISKENAPEIAGVTVASKGAESVTVRTNIIQAVSTLLGIGTNKICVIMRD